MARRKRMAVGGTVFHVMNRAVGRRTIFPTSADYHSFQGLLFETVEKQATRLCGYCIMPNHWHLVLWPEKDDELPRFMHRLTCIHAMRWRKHTETVGNGHLYQSRYKSFAVQDDDHYLTVMRYVERNALRGGLVPSAEAWPFSSLHRREIGATGLAEGPRVLPTDWTERVNRPQTKAELAAVERSVRREVPFGSASWKKRSATALGLDVTKRPRGRPKSSR